MAVREKTREPRPSETAKTPPVPAATRAPAPPAQTVSKRPLVEAQKGDPAARARAAIVMQKQAGNARAGMLMQEAAARASVESKVPPKIYVAPPTLVKAPTAVPQTVSTPVVSKEASKTIVTTTMSLGIAKSQDFKVGMVQPASPAAEKEALGVGGKGPATPSMPTSAGASAPEPPAETPKPTTTEAAPAAKPDSEKKDAKGKGEKTEEGKTAEGAKPEAKEENEKPKAPSAREKVGPAIAGVHQRAKSAHKKSPQGEAITNAGLAAKVPDTERKREGAAATVVKLGEEAEKAPNVAREQFIDTLTKAIEKKMGTPKTESDAEHVMKEGAKEANAEVNSHLATQREATEKPLREAAATEVAPTTDVQKVDFKPEEIGAPPKPVSAASVVPDPLPDERLDYSSDRAPTDQAMAENNITKEQLEKGNEPAFNTNLEERSGAEANEAKLATRYRDTEKKIQGRTHAIAAKELSGGLGEIHGSRELHVKGVVGQQTGTKDKGAAERTRITNEINGIKDRTRNKVKVILQVMEAIAPTIFSIGLQAAEGLYSQVFKEEKGGFGTWITTWGDDWKELIENSLATAKSAYKIRVRKAIADVADFVDGKLAEARRAVEDGRTEVANYVKNLADNVRQYGEDAQKVVDEDFAAMDQEVDSRRDALVEALVDQAKASYERMSAMEEKLREENKSIWEKLYDATVGLIKKIIAFKDMLVSILRKAAELIVDIITDPIGFLGNLIDGVMTGLNNFITNLPRHLLQGLMKWLFGALGEAGLEMPESFDLKGIVSIILQIFGLTYANFRKRAVDIVGEPVVSAIEKTAEVFKIVMTEGIPGLWRLIQEKVLELKSMVLDAIFDYIKEKVLMAGVTWIIGLLNPASAFFKACKAIYDIVVFFIERGSQIIDLVNAIIDSISAIVKGNIGVAAKMVEDALAKAIPVAIGFLASLLGLGNISGTIRKTIDKAREPVNKAIDWVINLAVKGVKAAGKFIGGVLGKSDTAHEDDPEKAAKIQAGLVALHTSEAAVAEKGELGPKDVKKVTKQVKKDHRVFKTLEAVPTKDGWEYEYTASEKRSEPSPLHRRFDPEEIYKMVRDIAKERFGAAAASVEEKKGVEGETDIEHKQGAAPLEIAQQIKTREIIPPKGSTVPITIGGSTVFAKQGSGDANLIMAGLGDYPEITTKLKNQGFDGPSIAAGVVKALRTGQGHPDIIRLSGLMVGIEPARIEGAAVTGPLVLLGMKKGDDPAKPFGETGSERPFGGGTDPVSMKKAGAASRRADETVVEGKTFREGTKIHERSKEYVERVVNLVYESVKDQHITNPQKLYQRINELLDHFEEETGVRK